MPANRIFLILSLLFATQVEAATDVPPSTPEQESPVTTQTGQEDSLNQFALVTPEIASQYALYSMLAANAYRRSDRLRFAVEKLGWVQTDAKGVPTSDPAATSRSGLAYDIFEKANSNEVIFSFRGTDSKRDFFTANFAPLSMSPQYKKAVNDFAAYLQQHPDKKVAVTGHSLGGALALTLSIRFGVDAIVFDSSPRIAGDHQHDFMPAKRVMIYEDGEILSQVRRWSHSFYKIVPRENIYKAEFNFGAANKHRSDQLALGLLKMAVSLDTSLQPILETVESK